MKPKLKKQVTRCVLLAPVFPILWLGLMIGMACGEVILWATCDKMKDEGEIREIG